ALVRAALRVHREMPGAELYVGDLSHPHGGPIRGHGSHQNGRDVDLLFYYLDEEGAPLPPVAAPIDPRGIGIDFRDLEDPEDDIAMHLDVPRTWLLIQSLLEQPAISVQRIFIVEHIRSMLLSHVRQISVPAETVLLFEHVTCQPRYPHDDHIHLRIYCAAEDISDGCRDTSPVYHWHRQRLASKGASVVLADRRRRTRPQITTAKQAREAAGPMHADVVRFLSERESWMTAPRTGRPYCR
ncbi:MAG: penicillin-insensitive murein endopeptidase, partial [Myxococcota bacterium]